MKEEESRKSAVEVPRGCFCMMAPEDLVLVTDPNHPLYDERVTLEPDDKMVRNVMYRGVIEPIGCRKNGAATEVVFGRQRVIAAIEANKKLVREGKEPIRLYVRMFRGEDKDLYGILLSENEHRVGDTPLAKAQKAQRMSDLGASDDEVCNTFGITKQCLANWRSLLNLAAPVKKAVEKGEISAHAAGQLASLSAKEQLEKLQEMKAEGGKITAERASRAVNSGNGAPRQRIRSRKEINQRLETEKNATAIATLRWVLNEDED